MSEENREEKVVEEVVNEEINFGNEEMNIEDDGIESMFYEKEEKITFSDVIKANSIDIVSTGVISVAALYIFDILLRVTAGYYVKDKISMLFIFYLISSLFYTSIMENKSADTIGKRASRIRITK